MRTERVVSRFVVNGLGSHNRMNHTAMDKQVRSVDQVETPGNGAIAAESIQADFANLLRVFDQQLACLSEADGPMHSHLAEARLAALRGLQLSDKLIAVFRASN